MQLEPVIGLEVHAQLLTESKIFCRCSTAFGAEPNSQTCPVCLGLPGSLPVLNHKAVEFSLRIALATNCEIASNSIFARKNYFYPDLPKGYQISQYEEPLAEHGFVDIEVKNQKKKIGITRIHLEEDAGKSIHDENFVDKGETLIDVNRCGVPLIEIVSEPDIRSPEEANQYLSRLRQLVRYLEICDGNMEEGSLRCDANVSVRVKGQTEFGVKTELKNMNSIRGVEKALEYEINRQIEVLHSGKRVKQQTLLWDDSKNEAMPMRTKESAHDYRYFPEPDLLPLQIDSTWIEKVRESLPELPMSRRDRFVKQYNLPLYDAAILTEDKDVADYFEETARITGAAKTVSNWIMGDVLRALKEMKIDIAQMKVRPKDLAALIKLIDDGTISRKIAKVVFEEMRETGQAPEKVVQKRGLLQISDTAQIQQKVRSVLNKHPEEVQKYKAGQLQILGFLVGQVMKATDGKANPKLVNEILRNELD